MRNVAAVFLGMCLSLASFTSQFNRAVAQNSSAPKTPDNVFDDKGLAKSGFWLILPNETSVHDGVWALKQADEGVRSEAAGRRDLRFEIDNGRRNLDAMEDKYVAGNKQYNQAVAMGKNIDKKDVDRYNASIELQNQLYDNLNVLWIGIDKQTRALEDLKTREEQVEDSRARYISLVMDIGTKAESIAKAYSTLAHDTELQNAIAQANLTTQPPLRLGPTPAFQDDLIFIRKCVKDVITGTVPVQKTQSGGLHVQAVLNGKVTDTMTWDSGADLVSLSYETGRALGIKPTDKDRSMLMSGADGRTFKAKLIVLDSIRLGGFTMHDVDCVLLPKTANPAPDLLGDTFQSHFLSRLDQRSGQLQLTPIDSSVTLGPVAEPLQKMPGGAITSDSDLARRATATASSTCDGYDPRGAIDGIIAGSPKSPQNEWACGDQTGSITLTWPDQLVIASIKLWDRMNGTDHILSGQLVFDDGTTVPFGELPSPGTPLTLSFRPKYIRWMRVEILTVTPSTQHPGFAEIGAYR
jgi:clan AA aspartic protease (TIGR02281 family)